MISIPQTNLVSYEVVYHKNYTSSCGDCGLGADEQLCFQVHQLWTIKVRGFLCRITGCNLSCMHSYNVCWLPSCSHRQRIRSLSCKTITIDIVVNGDATITLQEENFHWHLNFAILLKENSLNLNSAFISIFRNLSMIAFIIWMQKKIG